MVTVYKFFFNFSTQVIFIFFEAYRLALTVLSPLAARGPSDGLWPGSRAGYAVFKKNYCFRKTVAPGRAHSLNRPLKLHSNSSTTRGRSFRKAGATKIKVRQKSILVSPPFFCYILAAMVISSIDLKDGHVVQLKNGKDLVLERDDADALIKEFDRYGEVAIIDLDAALGNLNEKGATKNTELLKSLLRKGNVRVGGGIRDVKKARELISLGAEKVIIGSAAWNSKRESENDPILNESFLNELCQAIGRQRIIISVDAIHGNIAVKGWTETSGIPLVKGAKEAEKYCSELLFTCVEKEGCMQGTDMALVEELRSSVKCRLVVAGGVSSVQEIASLEKMGCDVQLGMALYTGKVSLKDAFISCLNFEKTGGMIPVIAQSSHGQVMMMGYANKEAFEKTFQTSKLTFFSRTRNALWTKGETSGHFLTVTKMRVDCDRDTVLATVIPNGGACHTGSWTCFTQEADEASSLERLYDTISERFANPKPGSYTATLNDKRVREKIMEEAEELTDDAEKKEDFIWEAADLLYFVSVLLYKEGVTWQDVYDELDKRHKAK